MATYAAYRHIELDKVGYSKKRVRNTPSEIFNVLSSSASCSPNSNGGSPNGRNRSSDSFNRLFGSPDPITPRRSSLTKHESSPRNPVTGDGVKSWDAKSRSTPRVRKERNPVTGEEYLVGSPVTTPTKPMQNGFHNGLQNGIKKQLQNGFKKELQNGHAEHLTNGKPMTNGQA